MITTLGVILFNALYFRVPWFCRDLTQLDSGPPEASVKISHLCRVPSAVHDCLFKSTITLKWILVLFHMGKLECAHRGTALIHCFHSRGSQWAHQCNGQWVMIRGICSFQEEKAFLWGFCGVWDLLFAGDYPMSPSW